jgi:hypothetical protein
MEIERPPGRAAADEDDVSPVEQVRLTVPTTDDSTLPVWTFRMWTMGFISCALLSFVNQFFAYRSEPIVISQITIQVRETVQTPCTRARVRRALPCRRNSRIAHACRWRRCR